jgi:hypothetical protein
MKTLIITCYSAVTLLGDLDGVDRIVKNIQPVYAVHSPVHRPEAGGKVSVSFLISATGLDQIKTREMLLDPGIKAIVSVTSPRDTNIQTKFQGCTSQPVTR